MAKASQELIAPPAEGKKTSYERWLESEGVPVVKAFFIEDIRTARLGWWERKRGYGAILTARGFSTRETTRASGLPATSGKPTLCRMCVVSGKPYKGTVDRREGGDQIEYRDEEPIVRQMFEEGLARQGIKSEMKKHYPNKL